MPIVQAFLLADRVFRDVETGKVIIAGTFNTIRAHAFPTAHLSGADIYLALTDFAGEVPLKLQLKHAKSDSTMVELAFPVVAKNKLQLTECKLSMPPLMFTSAGEYHIELVHADSNVHIATIRLQVVQIEGG